MARLEYGGSHAALLFTKLHGGSISVVRACDTYFYILGVLAAVLQLSWANSAIAKSTAKSCFGTLKNAAVPKMSFQHSEEKFRALFETSPLAWFYGK